ncbi:MAG: D-alanyl-D-alanine carboxypeptidase [Clostridiales bacterium]|nr:D-alanyl-D-alanine carboxypeptidase [Clostridiales bacterium]
MITRDLTRNPAKKGCILTVASNLQIIFSRSRKNSRRKIRMTRILAAITIAALMLTGAVPSFAETLKASDVKVSPSAKINWEDGPSVIGTSAIIMDAGSGDILYEKNIHDKRDPASITKVLNCLVVLETMDLDEEVTVTEEPVKIGCNIDLKVGETITVEELLYAIMLPSANDAAEVLAIAAGGSIDNFCDMMNERAARCGAVETNFTNPNGLNTWGQENHRTSAYDLAMITKEAMTNPMFRKLVSTKRHTIPATNMSEARKLRTTNYCMMEGKKLKTVTINGEERSIVYKGCKGIKTGSTGTAGECYCGYAKRGNTALIAITLNATTMEERFSDVIQLWDYGFSKYSTYTVAQSTTPIDDVKVKRGDKSKIEVGIKNDMDITLNKGYDKEKITSELKLNEAALEVPVKKGQVLGTFTGYKEGAPVACQDVYALESVGKGGPLSYIGIADEDLPFFFIGLISIIIVLILIRIVLVKMRRNKKMRRRAQRQRSVRRREREKEKNPFDF